MNLFQVTFNILLPQIRGLRRPFVPHFFCGRVATLARCISRYHYSYSLCVAVSSETGFVTSESTTSFTTAVATATLKTGKEPSNN